MAKKTQGWYFFADGAQIWFYGLSAQERKREEHEHGKVVRFIPT